MEKRAEHRCKLHCFTIHDWYGMRYDPLKTADCSTIKLSTHPNSHTPSVPSSKTPTSRNNPAQLTSPPLEMLCQFSFRCPFFNHSRSVTRCQPTIKIRFVTMSVSTATSYTCMQHLAPSNVEVRRCVFTLKHVRELSMAEYLLILKIQVLRASERGYQSPFKPCLMSTAV